MKKKLFVSTMSLIMAIVLMTSTSFAWFTVSTAPEATDIKVEMTAYKNLEIRVGAANTTLEAKTGDAGDLTKWGASVNYASAGVTLSQMATLDTTSGVSVKTAKYDTKGRVDTLEEATLTEGTDTKNDAITYANGATPTIYKDADGKICAAKYNMWLRSNAAQTVTVKPDVVGTAIDLYLYDGTTATKLTTAGTTFALAADTEKNIQVFALVDGTTHYAKDIDTGDTIAVKLSFTGDNTTTAT